MRTAPLMTTRTLCAVALILVSTSGRALATPVPILSGTVAFSGPDPNHTGFQLNGTVDYAVWNYNDYTQLGLDYVPTNGELVYTYVIHNNPATGPGTYQQLTGNPQKATEVSQLSLTVLNAADKIGQYTITGGAPADLSLSVLDVASSHAADWVFSDVINPGNNPINSSYGLAFSSPNKPTMQPATLFDNGTQSGQPFLLPSPSPVPAPEPGTLVLLGLGALLSFPALVRRVRARAR